MTGMQIFQNYIKKLPQKVKRFKDNQNELNMTSKQFDHLYYHVTSYNNWAGIVETGGLKGNGPNFSVFGHVLDSKMANSAYVAMTDVYSKTLKLVSGRAKVLAARPEGFKINITDLTNLKNSPYSIPLEEEDLDTKQKKEGEIAFYDPTCMDYESADEQIGVSLKDIIGTQDFVGCFGQGYFIDWFEQNPYYEHAPKITIITDSLDDKEQSRLCPPEDGYRYMDFEQGENIIQYWKERLKPTLKNDGLCDHEFEIGQVPINMDKDQLIKKMELVYKNPDRKGRAYHFYDLKHKLKNPMFSQREAEMLFNTNNKHTFFGYNNDNKQTFKVESLNLV